jgi:short-subunit dehydrogenase
MTLSGKRIVVVGGSGALGSEFVNQLTAAGAEVIATARTEQSAARIPASAHLRLLLDLEHSESISAATNYLNQTFDKIDGIVLAAGLVGFGGATETSSDSAARIAQVNYLSQIRVASELLATLQKSEFDGRFIVGISGVVAEKVFPGMLAYSASKSAFSNALKSLHLELRRSGILVTDARPGHTETGLSDRAIFGQAPKFAAGMTAEHVVRIILSGISERKTEIPSTDF